MKISKLVLNNFSSYENINIFDFTNDDQHPIILIGGQNGAGKTSLFTAIKVALYGPLAFGYIGNNSFYTKKIKELINSKVFQSEDFIAGVSIEISIKQDREIKTYNIVRNWSIKDKKLIEDYYIEQNHSKLNDTEKNYFESFLMTIIPPDLFDFFLFDGEEIGNIFSSDNYNRYVKNALLTMCGIDVFSIIQKFCKGYIDKATTISEAETNQKYNECMDKIDTIRNEILENKSRLQKIYSEIENLNALIEQKKSEFIRAGGILEDKRKNLQQQADVLDKKRAVISSKIKNFVENTMPFFILKDFSSEIYNQINTEEKKAIYDYVKYMVSEDYLNTILKKENIVSENLSSVLYNAILSKLNPGKINQDEPILDLSNDAINKIEQILLNVDDFDVKDMISSIKQREEYSKKIIEINTILRESLSESDEQKYEAEIKNIQTKIEGLQIEYTKIQTLLEVKESDLEKLIILKDDLYKKILDEAQNHHIYEMSNEIASIMERLIEIKTQKIREELSVKIIENLNSMYRKDNLISIVEIDSEFHFNLYQKQSFNKNELQALLDNVGKKEFIQLLGDKSISILYNLLDVSSTDEIISYLNSNLNKIDKFDLYIKIELSRLSKGERQIFILALYWAIIQVSGQNIPFIIDTPYARIDASHREEISRKFFPNISEQVIILSTDEEISEDYYHIIKPYVAKEYLLLNNQDENKTTVENRYFFEV